MKAWQERSARALELVGGWARGPERVAVENLENYPPDFVVPVFDRVPVSRCVDVGHLWLDGHDPLPHLRRALPRTRVIHLHGVAERDHKSLLHVPPDKLRPVVQLLFQENYTGVLTLEVFDEADFHSSKTAFEQAAAAMEKDGGQHGPPALAEEVGQLRRQSTAPKTGSSLRGRSDRGPPWRRR